MYFIDFEINFFCLKNKTKAVFKNVIQVSMC